MTHVGTGSAETGAAGGLLTSPRTPRVSIERLDEDLVSGEPEVSHHCCTSGISVVVHFSCSSGRRYMSDLLSDIIAQN